MAGSADIYVSAIVHQALGAELFLFVCVAKYT